MSPVGSQLEHHSDKSKFCSDLNKQKGCELSECLLRSQQKFPDFQAEYEGSIPFTRSTILCDFLRRTAIFCDRARSMAPHRLFRPLRPCNIPHDGWNGDFKFFSWLEGVVCTTRAPGDQEQSHQGQCESTSRVD
ncbi:MULTISPECIES: hypothetical protein [unclassified Bradyrhizobium]|uniref:hypothetical protein n=1 Tax=unclassified Bradyrhizobium TaxID=2631580 RepID=UPI001FFB65AD|nr:MULTISPECIES: hypothetical protein [unclassified Bradyrhizobium]MCK1712782.1 hypothetical protein [Bradyrhizobium sp. 143]MCK1726617.1 hypothetical protein [Bradyrhizobium sp. 142]